MTLHKDHHGHYARTLVDLTVENPNLPELENLDYIDTTYQVTDHRNAYLFN